VQVAEQVEVLKQALKQKKKQLAGMEAEMATFKAAMNDNKFELDRTVSQIQRLEKLYVSRFA
jgi:chromosome segregation ATPase